MLGWAVLVTVAVDTKIDEVLLIIIIIIIRDTVKTCICCEFLKT